jgi:hypothetical protein
MSSALTIFVSDFQLEVCMIRDLRIVTLFLSIAFFSVAFPVFADFNQKSKISNDDIKSLLEYKKQNPATSTKTQLTEDSCITVAGNWKGTCISSDGKTEPQSMAVAQSRCNQVVIDGVVLNPGGTNRISSSFQTGGSSDISYSPDWTPLEFVVRTRWNVRAAGVRSFYESKSEERFRLENGDLLTQESTEVETSSGDSTKRKKTAKSCRFQKESNL